MTYFCSDSCLNEFLAPEKELRKLKIEVLARHLLPLPILFFTYFLLLPVQSTNYALFVLDTPIQFIVEWSFHRETYDGIKNRTGNMDMLIAVGITTAYGFSIFLTPRCGSASGAHRETISPYIPDWACPG